jgi:hypothetical protein
MKALKSIILFPVFDYCVHVEISSNVEKAFLKYDKTKDMWDDDDKLSEGWTINDPDNSTSFIFLKPNVTEGTIAHESWHAILNMLVRVGADLDNEVVAYHLGYLVDEIVKLKRSK